MVIELLLCQYRGFNAVVIDLKKKKLNFLQMCKCYTSVSACLSATNSAQYQTPKTLFRKCYRKQDIGVRDNIYIYILYINKALFFSRRTYLTVSNSENFIF